MNKPLYEQLHPSQYLIVNKSYSTCKYIFNSLLFFNLAAPFNANGYVEELQLLHNLTNTCYGGSYF